MKFSAGKGASGRFEAGYILVVPVSSFVPYPSFFRVDPDELTHSISLRALGSAKTAAGYIPDSHEYHTSICNPSEGYVNTWCGKAMLWDGVPC